MPYKNKPKPSSNIHHFTFCPKYRSVVMVGGIEERIEAHIMHICQLYNIHVIAVAVEPDHVHLLLQLPRTLSQSKAMQLIKWYSALKIRKEFPHLKRIVKNTSFWQRNYFAETVGHNSKIVKRYINSQ